MPDFDADKLTLDVAMTSPDGQRFQVEVEASYPFEMIVDWPGLPGEFDVRAAVGYEVYR